MKDEYGEDVTCLDDHKGDCKGEVQYRPSLSGTGTPIPRCDKHWTDRLDEQDRINERYGCDSDIAPSWFHRSWGGANEYGEHWSEEDY
jgi:hypothetical protein